jgi:hypothetical protein
LAGNYLCIIGIQIPIGSKPKNATAKRNIVGGVVFFYNNQKMNDITCKSNLESYGGVWKEITYNNAPSYCKNNCGSEYILHCKNADLRTILQETLVTYVQ